MLLLWEDECRFSHFAQPWLNARSEFRLSQRIMLSRTPDKALSYYGIERHDTGEVYLYPCRQRPIRDETVQFLHWMVLGAAALLKKGVLMIWDNAGWHVARTVKRWIRPYNLTVKLTGKPRLLVWPCPSVVPG